MAEVIEIIEKKIDFKKRIITYKGIDTNYDGFPYRINLGNHLTDLFTQDFAAGNEIKSGDLINIHSELDSQRTKLNSYITEINTYKTSKSYLSSLGDIDSIPALYVPENAYQDDLNYTLLSDYVNNIKYLKQAQLDIQDKFEEIRQTILNFAITQGFLRGDGTNYCELLHIIPANGSGIDYPNTVFDNYPDIWYIYNTGNVNAAFFQTDTGSGATSITATYTRNSGGPEGTPSTYLLEYKTKPLTINQNMGGRPNIYYLNKTQYSCTVNNIAFKRTNINRVDIVGGDSDSNLSVYGKYLNSVIWNTKQLPMEFSDLKNTNTQNLTLDLIKKFEL